MTVAVKYAEMNLLEGFHCISFSTGSVQGNFLRYEFLKKKILQRLYSVTKRRTRTRRSRSRVTCATRSSPGWSIYTTTTTTQSSPRTSSSAPTARNRSCSRVVGIIIHKMGSTHFNGAICFKQQVRSKYSDLM